MPFDENLKLRVRRASAFRCCMCHGFERVEIHHIIPQEEDGPDTEDNAASLCPNCHSKFGDNPKLRKLIREQRDHWHQVVTIKFPICTPQAPTDSGAAGRLSLARMKEELRGYLYSIVEATELSSLPRLTDLIAHGLRLDSGESVPLESIAWEGPCACERATCVDQQKRVYCYFTKDQSPWVVGKRLYWRCYDEIIECPRCGHNHARGHVGRDDVCLRPYLNQTTQSDSI